MHNPNYKAPEEDPNAAKEHDTAQLNEYYKEDPQEPGDPDGPIIRAIEEGEEISKHSHENNKTDNSSDAKFEEHLDKVAHPAQNPKPKRISRRKKIYYMLASVFLILLITLVILLIVFRNTILGVQYNSASNHNETLSTGEEFFNTTTTIPSKAILANETV